VVRDILEKRSIQIFPSTAPPSRSEAVLMVASQTPLPAGPPSTTGVFRGTFITADGLADKKIGRFLGEPAARNALRAI
jgi:hypothetical protein